MAMNVTYLANILNLKSDRSESLHDVQSELLKLKQWLYKNVEEKKTNVKPLVAENERLTQRTCLLRDKTKQVIKDIEEISVNVNNCARTINDTVKTLSRINLSIEALGRITIISELLGDLKTYKNDFNFSESAKCLLKLEEMVTSCKDLTTLNIFVSLCRQIDTLENELLLDMKEMWTTNVKFNVSSENNKKIVGVMVNKQNELKIQQIVKAVLLLQNSNLLEKFFCKVKDSILIPVMKYYCEVTVEEKNGIALLSVTIKEGSGALPYWKIFDFIKTVIIFLKSTIGDDIISPMGQDMAHEVVSSLVKLSLSDAVLSPSGKFNSFEEIVKHAEDFQTSLQELGFLPKQYVSFLNDSAGLFFAEKMYLSYLERARFLMKSDLHNTIQADELPMPNWNVFSTDVADAIKNNFIINNKSKILMESQTISKSAQDVWKLVKTILIELVKTDENHNKRLMFAVRNIFEMYGAIVPLHHAKLLSTIPQHAAIFHNNCLHFTFRLILLASNCLEEWQTNLRDDYHIFLDQAAEMRQLAVTSLENCVSCQRNQILSIITDSGLVRLRSNPNLEADTDKSLRQCIRQIELLKNVWTPVLSESVYSNSMGYLIDEFTEAVVAQITLVEDISKNSATNLVKMLTIVEERVPAVFKDPREVHRLCRKWSRFRELIFVLQNNLDAFSDRWASGLGPLAVEFSKTEAQTLIRALFRNTEQRAAVLSHIYNS